MAGTQDTGTKDAGTQDTGTKDAGTQDTGTKDTGTKDTGTKDTGTKDTGTKDTGTKDAGTQDTGTKDTGTKDAGTQDTEENITIPDELKAMGVDDSFIDTYKILAKSLPEDQRGQLLEAGKKILEQQETASANYWKEQDGRWIEDLKKDKVIGGDSFDANMVKVNKVLAKFDEGGELVDYLKSIHHQNCAPMIKFIARMAPHFGEDVFVGSGDSGKKGDVPLHEKMGYTQSY